MTKQPGPAFWAIVFSGVLLLCATVVGYLHGETWDTISTMITRSEKLKNAFSMFVGMIIVFQSFYVYNMYNRVCRIAKARMGHEPTYAPALIVFISWMASVLGSAGFAINSTDIAASAHKVYAATAFLGVYIYLAAFYAAAYYYAAPIIWPDTAIVLLGIPWVLGIVYVAMSPSDEYLYAFEFPFLFCVLGAACALFIPDAKVRKLEPGYKPLAIAYPLPSSPVPEPPKEVITESESQVRAKLWRWNVAAGLLHLGSSLYMAPWVRLPLKSMSYEEWTVHATYTSVGWNSTSADNNDCGKDECTIQQCTHYVDGGIPLESLTFGFHFGSALAHLWYAYDSERYYRRLKTHGNPLRWIEYAITAALMIVVIMVTMGIVAVWELVSAAVLTAGTQFYGWLCETAVQVNRAALYRLRWNFFWVGAALALPPWVSIFVTYNNSRRNSDVPVPWFVTAIVIGLFVMFTSFAVVMALRLRARDPSEDGAAAVAGLNVAAEKRYIILSFVSKALLAWLLWFGAFRRNSINLKQALLPAC